MTRINYVELPAARLAETKDFYQAAFGFTFSDFGETYAATTSGDVDLGLQGDSAEATTTPLPALDVHDLAAALAAVEQAGGIVTRPIFAFPGGRRFHFRDPSGNELAVVRAD